MNPPENAAGRNWPVWLPALVAGTVAAIVRLIYVFDFQGSIAFTLPIMDESIHDMWARGQLGMLHEGVPYFRAPLYVWFLQAVYALDAGYLLPRVLQALMGAATVALVADLGRRLAGPVAGLVGGLLLAFTWTSIYFTGELLIVTLFVALLVTALWAFVVATQSDRPWLVFVGAAVLGLASIARPTALTFLPAFALLAFVIWPRSEGPRLKAAPRRTALIALAITLLPGLALTVRNATVGGDLVFIASQGGVNFYIGNNPDSDGQRAVVPGTRGSWLGGYQDTIARAQEAEGRTLKPSEISRWYYGQGLRYWVDQPGDALALYGLKLRKLFGAAERPNNKNLHFWRAQSDVLRWPLPSFATMLGLGLVGLVLVRRNRLAAPLWSFLALYAVGLLLFFLNERFRLPLTTVLAVFAGIPIARMIASVQTRRWLEGAVVLLAAVAIWGASSTDRLGFNNDRVDVDAFSRATLGNMYLRKGDAAAAVSEYQTALDIGRRYRLKHFDEVEVMVRKSMVRALTRLNQFEAAAQHLETLEASRPDDPEVAALRAIDFVRHHDFDDARPRLRRLLDRGYETAEVLRAMGWVLIDSGAHTTAMRNFQRSLALEPNHPEAVAGLAAVELEGRRNVEQAMRMANNALGADPDTAAAHEVLFFAYMKQNDLARAVYHGREVRRLDPFNQKVSRLLTRMGVDHEHPEGTQPPGDDR